MDYINYVKEFPLSMMGMGGGIGGFAFLSGGSTPQGLYGYGQATNETQCNAIEMNTIANATDYGNLSGPNVWSLGSFSNGTDRGIWGGGTGPGGSSDAIRYIGFNSPQNSADFGDCTESRADCAGAGNSTIGIFYAGGASVTSRNNQEKITIATLGNGTDFGDSYESTETAVGCANETRALWAGNMGSPPSYPYYAKTTIAYTTIAGPGNSSDFGDLSVGKRLMGGLANSTRGIFAGGYNNSGPGTAGVAYNTIEYVTIASTGNTTDFGDLLAGANSCSGCANEERGVIWGGFDQTSYSNVIQYITIASTGNSTDFGDLANSKTAMRGGACCGGN